MIVHQRCFQIPKKKLDLFLCKLNFCSTETSQYNAEYVFDNGSYYDVVVHERKNHYPFQIDEIEKFARELKDLHDSEK